jgi:hypothetical protein
MRQLRRNDEYLGKRNSLGLYPRWQVINALPVPAILIQRVVVETAKDPALKSHLKEVYDGVDGRDVHPRDWMDPHPSLLPQESAETSLKRRSDNECDSKNPCWGGYHCQYVDMAKTGTCQPNH